MSDAPQPPVPQEESTPKDDDNDNDNDGWKQQRDASKAAADDAFRQADYTSAISHYTAALSVDPDNAKILSNRSAAYLKTNQKSKALHDATACVAVGTMGAKGYSRLAAALQSLGRWKVALVQWKEILKLDSSNQAALQGVGVCTQAMAVAAAAVKEQEAADDVPVGTKEEEEKPVEDKAANSDDAEEDDLDDFFNDVETAATTVVQEREALVAAEDQPVATNKIASHKKNLGTAAEQIERLLEENYQWRNLNPFYVLDIEHDATKEDISRRYKALSLLLHPDKNRDNDKAEEAYDQVLKAKGMLDDDDKANHVRQLAEQGMIQGKADWERRDAASKKESLESFQTKAIQRIFAQIEFNRREVDKRQRNYEQRERQQEDDAVQKEKDVRSFDNKWKGEERVEKRIGNWRDFAKKKKKKL